MSPPNQADSIDPVLLAYRVDALEKVHAQLFEQLRDLNRRQEERHEALALKLDAAMTHMRAHACPSPGSCVSLMRDTSELTKTMDRFQKVVEKHENQINDLRTTAAEGRVGLRVTIFWVGVMSAGIGAVLSLVGPAILGRLQ